MKKTFCTILFSMFLITMFGQINNKFDQAQAFYLNKEYLKSIDIYNEIMDSVNSDYQFYLYYLISDCNFNLLNYNESKSDLKKALKIKKSNSNYLYIKGISYWLLGRIYSKENDLKKTIKYLKKASKYYRNSYLYSTIAYEQNRQKNYKEAIKNSNIAISWNEDNPYAYSNRAFAYLNIKEYQKARIDINKSYTLDSDNPYLYKHSALIYIAIGDINNACIELQIAKQKGYYEFGNESDKNEVNDLIEKYCNTSK